MAWTSSMPLQCMDKKNDALLINSIPTVVKLVFIKARACSSSSSPVIWKGLRISHLMFVRDFDGLSACGGEHSETLPVLLKRPLLPFVEAHIDLFCCQGEENFCSLALSPCQLSCFLAKQKKSGCLKLTGFKIIYFYYMLLLK